MIDILTLISEIIKEIRKLFVLVNVNLKMYDYGAGKIH